MQKKLLYFFLFANLYVFQMPAQQNWAAIPCSKMKPGHGINKMFIDSLHNKIVLFSGNGYEICNTPYKGIYAYDGNAFHDLDFGINKHKPELDANGAAVLGCITFGNKTLFGGGFFSIGSDTLFTKSIALWNGSVWDTFPTRVFDNTPNWSRGGGFQGFLKHDGKLWMYGMFDTIGTTINKNIAAYDGNTFIPIPAIPVSSPSTILKMVAYKNKLIATGNFDNYPLSDFSRLAQFDGTSWSQVGNGVQGNIAGAFPMTVYKDTLYIAGTFSKADGNAGNYIMKWDGSQLRDAGFGGFCGYGAILSLLQFKNRLYAFGDFGCAAYQKTFGMAYYENGAWTVSQDSVDNVITSAVVYNDAIYIGGGFESINGDTTIQKFARLMCPDFDATTGCLSGLKESSRRLDVKIFPNPSKNKIEIEFDQNIVIDKISISNALGQELYNLFKPMPKQEIDISILPAGIYFLKAENKQGQGVFKVVKE